MNNYPGYEVGVPFSLFEKAEKAVQAAYGPEDAGGGAEQQLAGIVARPAADIPILSESVTQADEEIPGPPSAGEDGEWYPEDATEVVWSTDSGEPSDFLVAALHENGIESRVDEQGTRAKLYVLPHDATQAREIVREVVEGEPPE
ncbi:MAG TPA: hypothetical protein VFI38_01915 [Candidatus Acidoferrum sp.]|nr:hypothetical protein [Candidatus Acidoferrum sp.]